MAFVQWVMRGCKVGAMRAKVGGFLSLSGSDREGALLVRTKNGDGLCDSTSVVGWCVGWKGLQFAVTERKFKAASVI